MYSITVLLYISTILILEDIMNNKDNYFNRAGQESFVDIFKKADIKNGQNFPRHWHEHLQIYYFISGTAKLECGKSNFKVQANDLVIVNPNELHYLESTSDNLIFYTIRFEPTFLFSNHVDLLQTKYLTPITLNRIEFNNLIQDDTELTELVKKVLNEYFNKETGYELAIKGYIYCLVVILLRNHVQHILSQSESAERKATLIRFHPVFEMIEHKYNEKITLFELASTVGLSVHHFCRSFKQLTGKTTTDYINNIRLDKAIYYLKQTDYNITEIALMCGFENVNYFSRIFKRYHSTSPSQYRNLYKNLAITTKE